MNTSVGVDKLGWLDVHVPCRKNVHHRGLVRVLGVEPEDYGNVVR